MGVGSSQWPSDDQIPTCSLFHPVNRPHLSFNGVSHSGQLAAPYVDSTVPVRLTAPPGRLPSTAAHSNIRRGDYVEIDVMSRLPL